MNGVKVAVTENRVVCIVIAIENEKDIVKEKERSRKSSVKRENNPIKRIIILKVVGKVERKI